ncbi:MAG: hypothetical protein AAFU85_27050, partial [Planctomycetota bacterium]
TLKVWDLESGKELASLAGHSASVRALALHPDGRRLVSGSNDSTLKVWDLESGKERRVWDTDAQEMVPWFAGRSPIQSVAASHRHIFAGDRAGSIHVLTLNDA